MTFCRTLLAATSALVIVGAASDAHAIAYAYSNINFTNLSLTGLTTGNVSAANISTSSGSNYSGSAADGATAGATNPGAPLTEGSDVRQSTSGPGGFPGANVYGQALLGSFGTRGDSQLTGNLLTGVGTGANSVAEGRLTGLNGTAGSNAGTSTGFNITVTVGASTTFTLTFDANDSLVATTDTAGEFASAQVNASFTIGAATGTGTVFTPFTFSPDALNQSVSSTGGAGNGAFSSPTTTYTTSQTLGAGTYVFTLTSGAQERLTTPGATPPTPVPEPLSLALIGSGLLGLGMLRRRNRA